MTWWPWHKKITQSQDAVSAAERLRDTAEQQQRQVEEMAPRVAAVSSSLQKLRTENHFGPMIDSILRGSE